MATTHTFHLAPLAPSRLATIAGKYASVDAAQQYRAIKHFRAKSAADRQRAARLPGCGVQNGQQADRPTAGSNSGGATLTLVTVGLRLTPPSLADGRRGATSRAAPSRTPNDIDSPTYNAPLGPSTEDHKPFGNHVPRLTSTSWWTWDPTLWPAVTRCPPPQPGWGTWERGTSRTTSTSTPARHGRAMDTTPENRPSPGPPTGVHAARCDTTRGAALLLADQVVSDA